MPAYSVSISVINLSTGQVETRHDAIVERADWITAFVKTLQQVLEDIPGRDFAQRRALTERLLAIVQDRDLLSAARGPRPV